MAKEFKSFSTVEAFKEYMTKLNVTRKIKIVQLHHTYSPSYKQFTGDNHISLQNGMRNYHINTNGWSDIAQQFTIFPDGVIMTGRDMNVAPAGIKGANSNGICIECLGNFDKGGDAMTDAQKNAIIGAVKVLLDRFGLNAKDNVTYHAWWTSGGTSLGDYVKGKSAKTCPGTNFFGGNTRRAFEEHLLPLLTGDSSIPQSAEPTAPFTQGSLKAVETVNDIVWELMNAGIITDGQLWMTKCEEDVNVYWLCRKMANFLRGTLE